MKVELTQDELGIINNALNEVCNGIDLEGEFDTRMGCTVAWLHQFIRLETRSYWQASKLNLRRAVKVSRSIAFLNGSGIG